METVNPTSASLQKGRGPSSTGFFMDTQGHCFLCLSRISSTGTPTPTYSLQYLSRYLKLNLGQVLKEEMHLPAEVVAKLGRGKLRARLCEGCSLLNDKFSELYELLERIRMEVEHCLDGIHGKLIQAVESGTARKLQCRMMAENSLDKILTLQVAEALRNQAIEKCSNKLDRIQPRVFIKKLKLDGICPVRTDDVSPSESRTEFDDGEVDEAEGTHMTSHSDDDSSVAKLECEICHLQVEDLSTHLYTAHFDVKLEVSEEPVKDKPQSFKPHYKSVPQNLRHKSDTLEKSLSSKSPSSQNTNGQSYRFNKTTGKYHCELCPKLFSNLRNWSIHHQSIHQNIRQQCSICGKEFHQPTSLIRHQKSVHLGRRFRCRTCGKVSTWYSNIVSHQRESNGTCRSGKGEIEVVMGSGSDNVSDGRVRVKPALGTLETLEEADICQEEGMGETELPSSVPVLDPPPAKRSEGEAHFGAVHHI